jgi:GlcNAc-P-P-Und epimerase
MPRVLVTGGSGFIGTNLVQHYLSRGDDVVSLDVAAPSDPRHQAVWRRVDILDRNALHHTVTSTRPEVVFHMAARTDLRGNSLDEYDANISGVENIINAVQHTPEIRLVVFASTMLVCRIGYQPTGELDYCPSTAYGKSKVAGEKLVRTRLGNSIPWIIVRPTSIWGPWFGSPYKNFFEAVQRGLYVHPRGRRIRRSYGFVLNTVAQLAKLSEQSSSCPLIGHSVYLADYEPIELKHWADTVQEILGAPHVREVPLWVMRAAAKTGDVLGYCGYKDPPLTSFRLNNLLTNMIHDISPLHSVCGELPHSMRDGVTLTCQWMSSQHR